jgi:hypothetical protein
MKLPVLPHAAVLKSVQAQKTNLHPDTIAAYKKGVLLVNKTDFDASWANALFCGFILHFCLAITISTRNSKAEWWQNKPCVATECPLDNGATSTG